MKMNPQNLTSLVKQDSNNLVATSLRFSSRFDPGATQDATNVETYDESILQQGRFWMRTVTWTLIGTTVFGVGWLALARTEEIVVAQVGWSRSAPFRHPDAVGGVADQILVKEDRVKAGQVLMKLDTEASEEQRNSLEKTIKLKKEQLTLKEEKNATTSRSTRKRCRCWRATRQSEILERFEQLEAAGAYAEVQILSQQGTVAEIRGKLMQSKADRLRRVALLDQQRPN